MNIYNQALDFRGRQGLALARLGLVLTTSHLNSIIRTMIFNKNCEICQAPEDGANFVRLALAEISNKYKIDASSPAWRGLVCATAIEIKYRKADDEPNYDDIVFGEDSGGDFTPRATKPTPVDNLTMKDKLKKLRLEKEAEQKVAAETPQMGLF